MGGGQEHTQVKKEGFDGGPEKVKKGSSKRWNNWITQQKSTFATFDNRLKPLLIGVSRKNPVEKISENGGGRLALLIG